MCSFSIKKVMTAQSWKSLDSCFDSFHILSKLPIWLRNSFLSSVALYNPKISLVLPSGGVSIVVLFIFCLITLLSPALTWSLLEELNMCSEESKGMKIFTCSVVCQVSNCQLFSVAVSKTIYPSMKSEKDLPDDYLSLAERSLVLCQVSYCHLFSVSVNELSTNYHP